MCYPIHNATGESDISQYLQELAQLPRLSDEEARRLLEQMHMHPASAEAERARMQLIEGLLHLVIPLARSFQGQGLDLADLIQEGNLALMEAIDQGDTQSPSFSVSVCNYMNEVLLHLIKTVLSRPEPPTFVFDTQREDHC